MYFAIFFSTNCLKYYKYKWLTRQVDKMYFPMLLKVTKKSNNQDQFSA